MKIENLHDRVRASADFILCQKAGIGAIYMGQSDISQISETEAERLFWKLAAASPVPVKFNGRLKKCYGRCEFKKNLRSGSRKPEQIQLSKHPRTWAERVKTLAHEITHAVLHGDCVWPGRPDSAYQSSEKIELEAELSAFIIADILGLPQLVESENYIFGFYKAVPSGLNILRARWAAAEIIKRI